MPLPSEANLQAEIGRRLMMDKTLFDHITDTGTDWITREETFLANVPADAQPAVQQAQARLRATLAAATLMTPDICSALWDTYARVASLPPGDFWERLTRYFLDNTKTVLSRGFSFGSFSAGGSNVGTGAIPTRITKDENNYTIESGFAEAKRAECIADQNSGAQRHEEVFRVSGAQSGKDSLELIGSGRFVDVRCLSPQSSGKLVPNCSFEAVEGVSGSTITGLTGWTPSAIGNIETVTSDYYRDNPQASTSRSIRFLTNASILSSFTTLGLTWNPRVPLYAQIAFKRESSCDGTLSITIGGKATSVALSAQSGWTILKWKVDTDAWFKNWNTSAASGSLTNAAVTIALASRTTGTLLLDDFIIGPASSVDGAWFVIVGGATPFLVRDVFTVTDTTTDTGIVQTIIARRYGKYLPHLSSSNTWTEPT